MTSTAITKDKVTEVLQSISKWSVEDNCLVSVLTREKIYALMQEFENMLRLIDGHSASRFVAHTCTMLWSDLIDVHVSVTENAVALSCNKMFSIYQFKDDTSPLFSYAAQQA